MVGLPPSESDVMLFGGGPPKSISLERDDQAKACVGEGKEGPIDKKTQRSEKCINHKGKEVKKK